MKLYLAGGEGSPVSRQLGLLKSGTKHRLMSFITGVNKVNSLCATIKSWDGELNTSTPIDIEAEIKILEDMEPGIMIGDKGINDDILSEQKPQVQNRRIIRSRPCSSCEHWYSAIGLYHRIWGVCKLNNEETRHDNRCNPNSKC